MGEHDRDSSPLVPATGVCCGFHFDDYHGRAMARVTVVVGGHENFNDLVDGLEVDAGHGTWVCHA
jgi:hypothetical protein